MRNVLIGAAVIAVLGMFGIQVAANMRLGSQVGDLETRLAQLEGQRKGVTPAADAGKVQIAARPVEPPSAALTAIDDLTKQLAALKTTVEALKVPAAAAAGDSVKAMAGPGAEAGSAGALAALTLEQRKTLEQAVEDVLKAREEQAQKERQARMEEMGKERINGILDDLTKKINLTQQQRDAILPIMTDTMKQMSELWQRRRGPQDPNATPAATDTPQPNRRDEMQKIMTDADTKIKSQLTAEQTTAYDEWRKDGGGAMAMGMGGMGGGRGGMGGGRGGMGGGRGGQGSGAGGGAGGGR